MAKTLRRMCGTMSMHHFLLEADPKFRERQSALEHTTQRMMLGGPFMRAGVTTIPVVVHVLWNKAADNVSDAQVKSQIDVLNRDYRGANPDRSKVPAPWKGLVSDARIQFALAGMNAHINHDLALALIETNKEFGIEPGLASPEHFGTITTSHMSKPRPSNRALKASRWSRELWSRERRMGRAFWYACARSCMRGPNLSTWFV